MKHFSKKKQQNKRKPRDLRSPFRMLSAHLVFTATMERKRKRGGGWLGRREYIKLIVFSLIILGFASLAAAIHWGLRAGCTKTQTAALSHKRGEGTPPSLPQWQKGSISVCVCVCVWRVSGGDLTIFTCAMLKVLFTRNISPTTCACANPFSLFLEGTLCVCAFLGKG